MTPPPVRCRHTWHAAGTTHTCWHPAGHGGDHLCRIGPCRLHPTTTERTP
jgi:hypothetical protein